MIVTIDVPDCYVRMLSEWASVSRTLNLARHYLENGRLLDDPIEAQVADILAEELHMIEPALNALHQVVRTALWKTKRLNPATLTGG